MSRDKSILSVHIDDGSLSIVYLCRTANGLRVRGSVTESLEEGVVKNGMIVSEEVIAHKIRNFCKAYKFRASKVAMLPSCSAVTLMPSEFSARSDEHMRIQVEEEIETYTLLGNEDIVFDYCTIEEDGNVSDKQVVLEAITTKQVCDVFSTVARKAQLNLVRIEPAPFPVIKLVYGGLNDEFDGVSLLLVLDSNSANISVFEKTVPRLCQNLDTGIKDISENNGSIDHLTDRLKSILEFSRSLTDSTSTEIVLRVAASCKSDQLREIADQIQKEFSGVIVKRIGSAEFSELFNIKDSSKEERPFLAFALALTALDVSGFGGQLNLLSRESLAIQKTQRQMSLTVKGMLAIILLAVLTRYPFQMKIKTLEAASAGIETKNVDVIPMKIVIASARQEIEELKKKQETYALATEQLTDIQWPQILQIIANTVPDNVRIVSISTTGSGSFMLTGEAWVESEVRSFAKKLQKSESIETAKVGAIKYDDSDTHITVKYEITCEVNLQGEKL